MIYGMMGITKTGMMGRGYGYFTLVDFFAFITWISLFAFLTLGAIYFWKQIQSKK